jgi:TonB-dependent SusC/RagA subfamily outer membrane receptor
MKHILRLLFFWVLSCGLVFGQGRMITGTVTDAEGNPIPGVTILIKGSTQGAATGMNGEYSINANEGDVLVFRFIGFASQEVTVGNQSNINISLADDNRQLDEVVVTGLATSVKRSNLANAVSTISAQDLVGVTNPATFDAALYGKLTGANITQSSGAPGGGISIRLRGISSIVGQNQPLFIVDGVYMDNSELPSGVRFASGANAGNEENTSNRMADIDPQDIESIEVLKGASAAAIYGTRANAGVVIITTKRGSAGKTKFTFSQDIGGSRVIRLLGQRDFTEDRVLADFGEVERQRFVAARNAGQLRDYEREIYGNTGLITDTRFTAVGGDNKTKFYVGGGYRSEEGIIRFTGHRRLSLRLNIDHKVSDFFDIAVSSSFVNSNADRGFTGNENEGGLSYGYNLAFTRPWAQLMPVNGNYPDNPYASGNPLLVRDLAKNQETTYRTIQSIRTNFNLLRRDNMFLKATISGGLDYFSHQTYVFVPETHQAQRGL